MTPEQFCYWLQGFSEIVGKAPDNLQWLMIHDHLQTVFHKVTPSFYDNIKKASDTTKPGTWVDTTKLTATC